MKNVVSEKGQVTIPKKLRDRLGIRPGQVLEFFEEEGRLIAVKSDAVDPVMTVYGRFPAKRSTDETIDDLRGRADRV